ncbi:Stp1/IreP family PP2C-type Ser/Thr phosphatase [Paenibacillus senegalensis]|uniref:Stp1/IreP family PP2C-type Ser/Thr phosphatase n=1 Tax=Paenibacillus senegalensis TaxID=1465766 RepID=UPI0002890B1A|nr:Stp1/IreP family PP2C-type Ser/Thr phosphatase [Paenibacillus senegalensis]
MRMANRSDVGLIRMVNEDRAAAIPDYNGYSLAIVADGMGGHQAGDTASQMAIETVQEQLQAALKPGMDGQARADAIEQAVLMANKRIYEEAMSKEHLKGMGTTVVVAVADPTDLVIGNIGDSRAYLFDPEGMKQLTEDHSFVNALVKSGQLSQEEADQHPRRNFLTRALGTDEEVAVDIVHRTWREHDIVMLCSDGLSGAVPQHRMESILQSDIDLNDKAQQLIDEALKAGGDDNITVVLLENESMTAQETR